MTSINSATVTTLPVKAVPMLAAGAQRGPAAFLFVEDVFDFSRIPAAPRLRLVISNSLSVKA